jgi:hypothetical protein
MPDDGMDYALTSVMALMAIRDAQRTSRDWAGFWPSAPPNRCPSVIGSRGFRACRCVTGKVRSIGADAPVRSIGPAIASYRVGPKPNFLGMSNC